MGRDPWYERIEGPTSPVTPSAPPGSADRAHREEHGHGVTQPAGTRIFAYWGKAAREGEPEPRKHLLVYHLLDVAAVGAVLLERHPTLLGRFAAMLELDEGSTRRWILWLLAHHDIGKLAAAFQRLRPDLVEGEIPDRYRYTIRHDTLGYVLWREDLLDHTFPDLEEDSPFEEALLTLAATSSGHHGRPPKDTKWSMFWFQPEDISAARDLSARLSGMFFGSPRPPALETPDEYAFRDRVARSSWSLAGFAVLCDWLGSNRRWFPFVEEPMALEVYWEERALPQAGRAVEEAAVVPVPARREMRFATLFPGLRAATGLQEAADTVPIASGPQLFIIEDLTGSGKTEAALTLAGRLLARGEGEGIYVALPTTANADAMYQRVGTVYERLFEPGSRPSLVLAHSRRDLSTTFRESIRSTDMAVEAPYDRDESGAAATCAAWLADSGKKALLAQVGVGTIDQALLAVLNVRHQSLRAVGLLGKVLIVDEVHACDAYMNRLLEHLLELHAAQGGSAILLSATLPLETRGKLVEAFCRGADFDPPAALPEAYPQLAAISRDGVHTIPAEPPPWSRRTLGFELCHDPEEAMGWVEERARAGAAVCWIRNTVADAIEASRELAERLGAGNVTLFHARFVLGERLGIEADVLRRFGKESGPESRRGHVVVATQVIEQSLDLDFDEMLSDLAPIDLLLQRAGRLRRHRRDEHGAILPEGEGPDRRSPPVLRVLTPEPVDDPPPTWISSFLPGTSFVYPDHAELWRTARLLRDRSTVRLPEDSRLLVEEVYGAESSLALPGGLQNNAESAEGSRQGDRSIAELNAQALHLGYSGVSVAAWTDDEDTRTRLGEPTVTLRLARWDGTTLLPMVPDDDRTRAWRLSEVTVRRRKIADVPEATDPALAAEVQRLMDDPAWRSGRLLLVPMEQQGDGTWEAQVLLPDLGSRTITYRSKIGLEVK